MKKYDYLIVGSGFFGSVFANLAKKAGKKCLLIEKRSHIGGNSYTEEKNGIMVHVYGAHIFHTSNEKVWSFVNQFASFNHFINCPIAKYKDDVYNLPFYMNTFSKIWKDVITPKEAKDKIALQSKGIKEITNLEEQAISLVGTDIYNILIKGYTEKQWGRSCKDLPAFIIKRLPLRFTYDNNYFNDRYQGIPIEGYTKMFENMLEGIDQKCNANYFDNKEYYDSLATKVVYTGAIDEFFDYCYGELAYRSLYFKESVLEEDNFQGVAVVNYTEKEVPYTRIIEHKHFAFNNCKGTIITKEYPASWGKGKEPYYPINDENNNNIYEKYANLAKEKSNVLFGGRLANYKYYNMDKVIESAFEMAIQEFGANII